MIVKMGRPWSLLIILLLLAGACLADEVKQKTPKDKETIESVEDTSRDQKLVPPAKEIEDIDGKHDGK